MPLIELSLNEKLMNSSQRTDLVRDLTGALLVAQGVAPDTPTALSITRAEVTLLTEGSLFSEGVPTDQDLARITFQVPRGSLDRTAKETLIETATNHVLHHAGANGITVLALNVWCIIHEVQPDNWGAAGRIWSWQQIKRFVAKGEINRRKSQLERDRQAN